MSSAAGTDWTATSSINARFVDTNALLCDVILSEDLSSTQDYGGLRVENPFQPG